MAMSQTDIDRVKAAFDTVKADMGRRTVRVVYTGSVWPARPTATTYVEWVDPTGTAPMPPSAAGGDTIVIGTGAAGVQPVELLTVGDTELTTASWWASTGTPAIDTSAGTITLDSSADRAARGGLAVVPGATLTLTVTPTPASSGQFEAWVDFTNSSNGYVASGVGTGTGTGTRVGSGTVPDGSAFATVMLTGKDGSTAVLDRVSLTQAV